MALAAGIPVQTLPEVSPFPFASAPTGRPLPDVCWVPSSLTRPSTSIPAFLPCCPEAWGRSVPSFSDRGANPSKIHMLGGVQKASGRRKPYGNQSSVSLCVRTQAVGSKD